jgi:hypothetical protein
MAEATQWKESVRLSGRGATGFSRHEAIVVRSRSDAAGAQFMRFTASQRGLCPQPKEPARSHGLAGHPCLLNGAAAAAASDTLCGINYVRKSSLYATTLRRSRSAPTRSETRASGWRRPPVLFRLHALGLRGPATMHAKPCGVDRIVCLGGSSTYGHTESSDDTTWLVKLRGDVNAAFPGRKFESRRDRPVQVGAVTSREESARCSSAIS